MDCLTYAKLLIPSVYPDFHTTLSESTPKDDETNDIAEALKSEVEFPVREELDGRALPSAPKV